ncbi:MAG TPA: type II and III secretion system protein family protein [Caulobacteraceae bacterium]|nr:type II and III secretion system protein family protein [Caulobacteraceae bacterium]
MRFPAIACMRLAAALVFGALAASPAPAQVMTEPVAPSRTIFVPKGKAIAFDLPSGVAEVVISQPETAEIVANNDRSVYVRGLEVGETNVLVYDAQHRLLEVIDVNVGFDAAAAQADIARAMPGENISVRSLGSGGLVVSGETARSGSAARAAAIAERYAPKRVASDINPAGAEQVMLEVRIVEANRAALKDFGISLDVHGGVSGLLTNALVLAPVTPGTVQSGLNGLSTPSGRLKIGTNIGTTSIDVILDLMEEKGLIRTLARPNLAAMSGEKASFLAGGEFPFPVPNGDENVTIEFKPFGVQLEFTPTVEGSGLIKLQVAPEVSQLDDSRPLRINGFNVPSMTIRRTATTVRLKDGETFAIAGLYQQEYANGVRQVPWLGDIPVLGALFRSTRWRRRETELVVLVTPRLATGAESLATAPDPLRVANEPSAIDLIMSGSSFDQPIAAPMRGLRGPIEVSKAPAPRSAAGS